MANTPARESAPTAPARLEASEVNDTADVSPRAVEPKLTGKRIRGIPAVITKNNDTATTIEVRPVDLVTAGGPKLDSKIVFDARVDQCTLKVGDEQGQVPNDVADFLTSKYPTSFEYMNEG